jgi:hypothetical protein
MERPAVPAAEKLLISFPAVVLKEREDDGRNAEKLNVLLSRLKSKARDAVPDC